MNEPIWWQELTRRQRNQVVAEQLMNSTRVSDTSLLPHPRKRIPNYSANVNDACLILLTFPDAWLIYRIQRGVTRIHVSIDGVNVRLVGGVGEECAEAICIAALRAVGLLVHL